MRLTQRLLCLLPLSACLQLKFHDPSRGGPAKESGGQEGNKPCDDCCEDDATFDKRIATRYLEVDKFPAIHFTADSVKIVGGHATASGTLEFHGIKKPLVLNTTYRGSAQSRMGFSAEASFKRSDFGVSQWIPLEADEVDVLEGVVGRHLVRFGTRDELVVAWHRDNGEPGTATADEPGEA